MLAAWVRCGLSGGAGVILMGIGVEPPQQKSVLGVGSYRGSKAPLPLAQRCLVGGWAAQGFGGFRTNKQGSVRAQRSESPSGPEVPIKVFFPLF